MITAIGFALWARVRRLRLAKDTSGRGRGISAAIERTDVPVKLAAQALNHRGVEKDRRGDSDGAITDYTAAIELPGAPAAFVALALVNRGIAKQERGDSYGAIADYTAAIELPGAPVRQVTRALCARASAKKQHGDALGAIADVTAAIEMPDAPAEVVEAVRARLAGNGSRAGTIGAVGKRLGTPGSAWSSEGNDTGSGPARR